MLGLLWLSSRTRTFVEGVFAPQVAAAEAESVAPREEKSPPKAAKPRPSCGMGGECGAFPDAKIEVGDKKREYRLIVPKKYDSKKPAPLVFAFHGLFDSKNLMPVYSQLDKLAEEKNFILVFPNGQHRHWPIIPVLAKDDLAFFDALYHRLTKEYNVDLNRVYLTGMSNGAYFSHLVASQRNDWIAAIAPHSGGVGFVAAKAPEGKKYAVLAIHGAEDSVVNVDEGRKTRDLYKKWGHKIEYVEIPGLNHFWANNIDVNHKIWDFFVAHPMSTEP